MQSIYYYMISIRSGKQPPGRHTEDISGRQPGRQIPSSIFSIVMKAPHETIHLALVTRISSNLIISVKTNELLIPVSSAGGGRSGVRA